MENKKEKEVKTETKEQKKKDWKNNYNWGFLGFFLPIIGIIFVFFWTGKYEKSVKGISMGIFLFLLLFLIIGIVYISNH